MRFKQWIETTQQLEIPLNKLFGWRPKVVESIEDLRVGKLSYTPGPINVSRLDSPRGAFFVLDGHHRVLEAAEKGQTSISATIDEYMPRIERTGGAHKSMVDEKVPIIQFAQQA